MCTDDEGKVWTKVEPSKCLGWEQSQFKSGSSEKGLKRKVGAQNAERVVKLMECKLLESRFLSSVQAPSRAPTCGVVVDCLCNMTFWVVFIPASRHLTNHTVFHVPAIFQFDNQCAINTVISQIGTTI